MKKILLLTLVLIAFKAQSQITYEHTYDSAATYNFCLGSISQLLMVDLEVSGEQYIKVNRCGESLNIYDLDHTLQQSISLATLPTSDGFLGYFMYFSENLFNTDSKMEFMYIVTSPTFATYIYDEDLNLLFSEPGAPMIMITSPCQQFPIYNTSAGTKMILSYPNGEAKVFGLGGILTTAIQESTAELTSSYAVL